MAGKRIDSILVKEAIEKELQFLAGNLDELAAKIKTFPAIRTKTEGAGNVKELSKAQIQYAESLKAVEQLVKQRMASEAKLITLQSDYAVATAKNRTEVQKMNREQKIAAEIALSQEGSIERARAKIKALTLEQSKLNLVTAEGRKRNEEINKSLDKYTEFIRKNVSAAEKQRMNVGNYQGSAKIIVDAMERARQKVVQVEKDFGKIGPEARAARGEFEALRQITQDNRFLNIAAKVGDTNKELRFFTQQLNALEDAGMKNSQVYADVRARLAQLTDQIADTKAEVKALSSDTRNFDLFAGSVNFAADAFQTFAGAAALAGASEEQVAEQIRTLVAIQSVANGVKGIANELTTKGTAANKAYAFVMDNVRTITSKTATSTEKLNSVLKLSLIGIAIAGLVKLVQAFQNAGDAAEQTSLDIERFNTSIENSVGVTNRFLTQAKRDIDLAVEKAKQRGASEQEISDIITNGYKKEAQEQKALYAQKSAELGKYTQSVDDLTGVTGKLITEYDKFTGKSPTAYTVLQRIADLKLSDEYKNFSENIKKSIANLETAAQKVDDIGNAANTALFNSDIEKERQVTKDREEAAKRAADAQKKRQEEQQRINEANRQAEFEMRNIFLQQEIDLNNNIVDDDTATWDERMRAAERYYNARQRQIEALRQFELNKPGLTTKQKDLVDVKARDEQIKLDQETSTKKKEISSSLRESLTADQQELYDQTDKFIDEGFKRFSDAEQARTDKQKEEANKRKSISDEENKYRMELINQLENFAISLFESSIERQKNAIQEQINLIEERKNKEIQRINESAISETQKVEKIKIAEAAAAAQTERLKLKQKQLDIEKAKFDKVRSIASIIQNTAQGITAALASIPPNPVLAGLIGAIGATQLATVLSTPIPRYAKGRGENDPYEGPAVVGEAGRELGVSKEGRLIMYDRPTLTYLRKGDVIHPNRVTEDMIKAAHYEKNQLQSMTTIFNNGSNNEKLEEKTDKVIEQLRQLNKRPLIIQNIQPGVDIDWVNKHLKY